MLFRNTKAVAMYDGDDPDDGYPDDDQLDPDSFGEFLAMLEGVEYVVRGDRLVAFGPVGCITPTIRYGLSLHREALIEHADVLAADGQWEF